LRSSVIIGFSKISDPKGCLQITVYQSMVIEDISQIKLLGILALPARQIQAADFTQPYRLHCSRLIHFHD
jgi:hypothetical protein